MKESLCTEQKYWTWQEHYLECCLSSKFCASLLNSNFSLFQLDLVFLGPSQCAQYSLLQWLLLAFNFNAGDFFQKRDVCKNNFTAQRCLPPQPRQHMQDGGTFVDHPCPLSTHSTWVNVTKYIYSRTPLHCNFEVLRLNLNICTFCHFILLLHCISEANIMLFISLHSSENFDC